MRFQKKRFAIAGGILAAFVLTVGVIAGITNKKEDAAAISDTASVSSTGWTGYLNGWRTRDFKLTTADGTLDNTRAWCGDIAGESPSGSGYTLKVVSITANSSDVEKSIFRAMYYGVAYGKSDVYIHETINDILNGDSVVRGWELYNMATQWELPNKNNMKIYYTDPNGWGLESHYRSGATQRVFSYSYEEKPEEMSLQIQKYWQDSLDSNYEYPDIKVTVKRTDGGNVLNADGSVNQTLSQPVTLDGGGKITVSGLQANQQFTITEEYADSGFVTADPGDGTSRLVHDEIKDGNRTIYYIEDQTAHTCVTDNTGLSAKCFVRNREYSYTGIRLHLNKVWDDEDFVEGRPEEALFQIKAFAGDTDITSEFQDGRLARFVYVVTGNTSSKRWSGYISNLVQEYEVNGQMLPVKYYVAEYNLPVAYEYSCDSEKKMIDGKEFCLATATDDDADIETTYTNTPKYTTVHVTKTWNDGRGAIFGRPRLIFYDIYRDDDDENPYTSTGIWNECYIAAAVGEECTDDDEWTDDIKLPMYYLNSDDEYVEAHYRIVEKDYNYNDGGWGGLSKKYEMENTDDTTMKNTAQIKIPVIKCWLYDDESTRPASLGFDIFDQYGQKHGAVVLTADDDNGTGCWTKESDALPLYDENGVMYVYTVVERQMDTGEDYYYEGDIQRCEVNAANRKEAAGDDEEIDFSCTFSNRKIELVEIPVIKCWLNDDETKRPSSMKFDLYFDDEVIDSIELTSADANKEGCWTGKFGPLPANDIDGNALTYYVKEDESSLEGYSYEADVEQCKVDVAARKAAAKDGEEVDMSCEFNNRYVDVPDTSAKSMNFYYFTIPAMLLGGIFITRKVVARK